MERPTDDYKLTNNVRLSTKDTLFGGQVSRYQVAELISTALSNPGLAENKVNYFNKFAVILPVGLKAVESRNFIWG